MSKCQCAPYTQMASDYPGCCRYCGRKIDLLKVSEAGKRVMSITTVRPDPVPEPITPHADSIYPFAKGNYSRNPCFDLPVVYDISPKFRTEYKCAWSKPVVTEVFKHTPFIPESYVEMEGSFD